MYFHSTSSLFAITVSHFVPDLSAGPGGILSVSLAVQASTNGDNKRVSSWSSRAMHKLPR